MRKKVTRELEPKNICETIILEKVYLQEWRTQTAFFTYTFNSFLKMRNLKPQGNGYFSITAVN